MKVVVARDSSCTTNNLEIIDANIPRLLSGEMLIEVKSASINPVDYKIVDSKIIDVKYPYIVGLDVSGIVVETPKNSLFSVGDRVFGHKNLLYGGGIAEYTKLDERIAIKLPGNISFNHGSAMACSGLTAYQGLMRKANLKPGSSVFIQGGGGGVGSFAILIAKKLGHTVFASSSPEKKDYIQSLGAIHIDYKKNMLEQILAYNNGNKVDMVFELVSYEFIDRDLDLVDFNGFICSIVGYNSPKYRPHITYCDVALGWAYVVNNQKSIRDLGLMGTEMVSLLSDDVTKLHLNIFPLDYVHEAFAMLKSSRTKGKIVIDFTKRLSF